MSVSRAESEPEEDLVKSVLQGALDSEEEEGALARAELKKKEKMSVLHPATPLGGGLGAAAEDVPEEQDMKNEALQAEVERAHRYVDDLQLRTVQDTMRSLIGFMEGMRCSTRLLAYMTYMRVIPMSDKEPYIELQKEMSKVITAVDHCMFDFTSRALELQASFAASRHIASVVPNSV